MNPCFVVTNLEAEPAVLCDELCCARGAAENRIKSWLGQIKEAQIDRFGTRASCHRFEANQFRLLLPELSYTLMHRLRAIALVGTELERAAASTVCVRLLTIGAAILRNTRRIRLMLPSHHPMRAVFVVAARRLVGSSP